MDRKNLSKKLVYKKYEREDEEKITPDWVIRNYYHFCLRFFMVIEDPEGLSSYLKEKGRYIKMSEAEKKDVRENQEVSISK